MLVRVNHKGFMGSPEKPIDDECRKRRLPSTFLRNDEEASGEDSTLGSKVSTKITRESHQGKEMGKSTDKETQELSLKKPASTVNGSNESDSVSGTSVGSSSQAQTVASMGSSTKRRRIESQGSVEPTLNGVCQPIRPIAIPDRSRLAMVANNASHLIPPFRETVSSTFHPHILPLYSTPNMSNPSSLALGINLSQDAARLASIPNQAQSRIATAYTNPLLLTAYALNQTNYHSLPITNRFPRGSPGVPFQSHPSVLSQAALLRLNTVQGDHSIIDGRSSTISDAFNSGPPLAANFILPAHIKNERMSGISSNGEAVLDGNYGNVFRQALIDSSASASLSNIGTVTQNVGLTGSGRAHGGGQGMTDAAMELTGRRDKAATLSSGSILRLPLTEDERPIPHFNQRTHVPLATDEDQNWLSEFLCFVRSELVEIFRANHRDVRSRNSSKKVFHGQVGIRCRFCAHLPLGSRSNRSSSFPSSLSRIYQSLTMMLRDHFGKCDVIPLHLKKRFLDLKGKTSQGATDSKHYWVYSAMKRGLVDSQCCIWVNESPEGVGTEVLPFRTRPQVEPSSSDAEPVILVRAEDSALVSEFLYTLMTQVQRVTLEESERTGNRRNLDVGLPGIGCRHCCTSNRKGLCRLFPVRRRTLPSKVNDLYEHIRRCTLCPSNVKEHLSLLRHRDSITESAGEKQFFDRIWARMVKNETQEGQS